MVVPLCSRTASYTAMTNDLGWTMKTLLGQILSRRFNGVPDVAFQDQRFPRGGGCLRPM